MQKTMILLLAVYSSVVRGDDADEERLQAVWAQVKGVECDASFSLTAKGNPNLTAFSCKSKNGEGKSGFLAWEEETSLLIWHRVRKGPPPILFAWVDFDDDKSAELFVLSGQEEAAWTEIFAKQGNGFRLVHSSDKEYGVVVDADRDEIPDLFSTSSRTKESDPCADLEFPSALASQIKDKYLSISAKYKDANYTYNMPEEFPLLNMYMLQKLQILKLPKRAQKMRDETGQFQDHIAWRINILEKLLKMKDVVKWQAERDVADRERCFQEVKSVIGYWKSKVRKPKSRRGRRKRS